MTETTNNPDGDAASDVAASDVVASDSGQTNRGNGPGWLLPTLVIAGLLCAYAGERAVVATQKLYYTRQKSSGFTMTDEEVAQLKSDMTRNFAVGFAAFGAIALGVTGLLVGLSQSLVRAMIGLVAGTVLGTVAGGILGTGSFLTGEALKGSRMESMLQTILLFAPSYLVFGIVASTLAAALCLQSRPMGQAIATGIKSATICMLLYVVISFIIPLLMVGYADQLLPENMWIRYAAYGLMALCTTLAAGFVIGSARSKSAETINWDS